MSPHELFGEVAGVAPTFGALLREHLRDHGELLPHVLMYDLLQYTGSHFSGKSFMGAVPPTLSEVQSILAVLTSEITAHNPTTENAIAVSFVEHIESESFFPQLRPHLAPALLDELARQKAWHGAA
jgi:hypothetical protein